MVTSGFSKVGGLDCSDSDGGHGFFVRFEFPFLGPVDAANDDGEAVSDWKDCYS